MAATPAPATAVAPEILYSGCAGLEGRVCARVADEPLRVWVFGASAATLRVTLDGRPLEVAGTEIDGGTRVEIEAGLFGDLMARIEGEGWTWGLELRPPPTIDPRVVALAAEAEKADADGASVRAKLEALLPALAPADRAEALALIGDIWFYDDDPAAAVDAYGRAFDPLVAAGSLRRANDIALTSSYAALILLADREASATWLERQAGLFGTYPEARFRHGYFAALLADRSGDLRGAVALLRLHERGARVLGRALHHCEALSQLGVLLARLGDRAGANAAFAQALALGDAVPAHVRARAQVNAAWVDLEALAQGFPSDDPRPRLREALELAQVRGDRPGADEARINLAYTALLQGHVQEARSELDAVEPQRPETQHWRDYLAAQIELVVDRPSEALTAFNQLRLVADGIADRALSTLATIGAGEALEALGRLDEAKARYRSAEAQQAVMLADIAINDGRERFAGQRDRSTRHLVDLLLRTGQREEALCAARQARVRAVRGLAWETRRRVLDAGEQRAQETALADYRRVRTELDAAFEASWRLSRRRGEAERARLRREAERARALLDQALSVEAATADAPCEALPRPTIGALRLFYTPLPSGYAAFALSSDGAIDHTVIIDLGTGAGARSQQLLGPFAAKIDAAERLEIVASGPLSAEAFHALPWRGEPLIAAVDVSFSMDLSQETSRGEAARRALLLAPPSNLESAPAELDAVEAALRGQGWTLERRRGDEDDLMARMVASDLLVYAGHAAAGEGGWESALVLAGDRRLSVGDLLALPGRAPARVVLSGCETGIADPRALAGGMSLASALLLAGAELVIATDARVDDRLAAALTPRLIAAIAEGEDGVHALAVAQRALIGAHPEWARFRAIVR
ncbi:MAG: CHAT domain-containing protein [Nannocystaceae bacterium]